MDTIVYMVFICIAGVIFLILTAPSEHDFIRWYKLLSSGIRPHLNNCRKAYSCAPGARISVVEVLVASIIGASIISVTIYYNLFVWAYLVLSLPYWLLTLLEWLDGGSSDD